VNNNCDNPPCTYGDASVNLYLLQPAACMTTTKTEQNSVRSVKSEADLWSTYCGEANDRHEASRSLFATAELLVMPLLPGQCLCCQARLAGRGIMFSACTFVHSSIHSFVCYQTCKHDILKTDELILVPTGTSGPRGRA